MNIDFLKYYNTRNRYIQDKYSKWISNIINGINCRQLLIVNKLTKGAEKSVQNSNYLFKDNQFYNYNECERIHSLNNGDVELDWGLEHYSLETMKTIEKYKTRKPFFSYNLIMLHKGEPQRLQKGQQYPKCDIFIIQNQNTYPIIIKKCQSKWTLRILLPKEKQKSKIDNTILSILHDI